MDLTENYGLDALISSGTAASRGIDNNPNAGQIAALTALCTNVLEPVTAHYGVRARVLSAFRVATVNLIVGDAADSQHVLGEAADIEVFGQVPLTVCQWIEANIDFDQLILERGATGGEWVHVSWRATDRRGETFTATVSDGVVTYAPGLPE